MTYPEMTNTGETTNWNTGMTNTGMTYPEMTNTGETTNWNSGRIDPFTNTSPFNNKEQPVYKNHYKKPLKQQFYQTNLPPSSYF